MTTNNKTAYEVIQETKAAHLPLDATSTDGIQRTLVFLEDALNKVAEHIDGPSKKAKTT